MKKEEGICLENFNTLDDFQKFIDDNNIINTSDFKKRFGSKIYKKLLNLGFGGKISFHGKLNRMKFSKKEIRELLNSFKDLEFSEQKTFDWLFYKKKIKN